MSIHRYILASSLLAATLVAMPTMGRAAVDPSPNGCVSCHVLDEAKGVRAQRLARYETTSANLARIKPLAAQNAVSQKDLDDATGANLSAKAELEAADANLKTAKLNLGFTRIASPVNGIAGIAKAQIGDLLSPSMPTELTTVSSVDPIKVYFNISEREYLKVANAAQASGSKPENVPLELILVDGSIYPHQGKVAVLNRQVDVTTGTFKVAALFPNPNNLLRPGQYGRVRATMSVAKGALLVPQRAVTEMQGKYLVAVVGADNKVDIRPVRVGERIGTEWLILEGLKPGETVIAEGTQKVRPGMTASALAKVQSDVFGQAGFGEYVSEKYTRGRGHGIGLYIDEEPLIAEENDFELKAGMVVMIHPNTYLPLSGYMVLGDPVLITENGGRRLSCSRRDLATVKIPTRES